jgi:hypothetical protein
MNPPEGRTTLRTPDFAIVLPSTLAYGQSFEGALIKQGCLNTPPTRDMHRRVVSHISMKIRIGPRFAAKIPSAQCKKSYIRVPAVVAGIACSLEHKKLIPEFERFVPPLGQSNPESVCPASLRTVLRAPRGN